jgi:hypothetical protein
METKGKSFSLSGNAMHIKEWQIPKQIHYEPLLSNRERTKVYGVMFEDESRPQSIKERN